MEMVASFVGLKFGATQLVSIGDYLTNAPDIKATNEVQIASFVGGPSKESFDRQNRSYEITFQKVTIYDSPELAATAQQAASAAVLPGRQQLQWAFSTGTPWFFNRCSCVQFHHVINDFLLLSSYNIIAGSLVAGSYLTNEDSNIITDEDSNRIVAL